MDGELFHHFFKIKDFNEYFNTSYFLITFVSVAYNCKFMSVVIFKNFRQFLALFVLARKELARKRKNINFN